MSFLDLDDLDLDEVCTLSREESSSLRAPDLASIREKRPNKLLSHHDLKRLFPERRQDLQCPLCGSKLVLKDGRHGLFYGCSSWKDTKCRFTLDAHPKTGRLFRLDAKEGTNPLLAGEAHKAFDIVWQMGVMRKKEAYAFLGRELGIEIWSNPLIFQVLSKSDLEKVIKLARDILHPPSRFEMLEDWMA